MIGRQNSTQGTFTVVNQDFKHLKSAIARRVRTIREDKYGFDGVQNLAAELRLPARTWLNYESGVTLPGEVLLRFIAVTSVDAHWLLSGEGPAYSAPEPASCFSLPRWS